VDRLTSAAYTKSGVPTETLGWTYGETGAGFSYGIGRLTNGSCLVQGHRPVGVQPGRTRRHRWRDEQPASGHAQL